ncbi:MAG: DUF5680 domain-containing protein [Candidatus Uhrbacteria bacterium]
MVTSDEHPKHEKGLPTRDLLASFLRHARQEAYAGNGVPIAPKDVERDGFNEFHITEDQWDYRDSYVGFLSFCGCELIRFNRCPIWYQSYDGRMLGHDGRGIFDRESYPLAKDAYAFLKRALAKSALLSARFYPRGPAKLLDGAWRYKCSWTGDIASFIGSEQILFQRELVYSLNFHGSIIIGKDADIAEEEP